MRLKPFIPTQDQVSRNRERWGSDYRPERGGHYPKGKTPSLPPERRRRNER